MGDVTPLFARDGSERPLAAPTPLGRSRRPRPRAVNDNKPPLSLRLRRLAGFFAAALLVVAIASLVLG